MFLSCDSWIAEVYCVSLLHETSLATPVIVNEFQTDHNGLETTKNINFVLRENAVRNKDFDFETLQVEISV